MAQPQLAATDAAIHIDHPNPIVQHNIHDKLPPELLQTIAEYLQDHDLVTFARVDRIFRAIGERELYRSIVVPFERPDRSQPDWEYNSYDHDKGGIAIQIYMLYRTLLDRTDLAQRIKEMTLKTANCEIKIPASYNGLFRGTNLPPTSVDVRVHQVNAAGALLQQLKVIEKLRIQLYELDYSQGRGTPQLMEKCLSKLLPGFDHRTAHLISFPGFQKLHSLDWTGSEFHLMLARLRCLVKLSLSMQCKILPDNAPHETNSSLRSFELTTRSFILHSASRFHEFLGPFLAHFTSLESVQLGIEDVDPNDWSQVDPGITLERQGSFAVLLDKLGSLSTGLRELSILYIRGDNPMFSWLNNVRPHAFANFQALEKLQVPYTSLFNTEDLKFRPPETFFPPSLKHLIVYAPQVCFLDYLVSLTYYRNEVPNLAHIELECANDSGDPYNEFVLERHPHPATARLQSIPITFEIRSRFGDWDPAWDNYDLKALDLVEWQESFGAAVDSIHFNQKHEAEPSSGYTPGVNNIRGSVSESDSKVSAWTARKRKTVIKKSWLNEREGDFKEEKVMMEIWRRAVKACFRDHVAKRN